MDDPDPGLGAARAVDPPQVARPVDPQRAAVAFDAQQALAGLVATHGGPCLRHVRTLDARHGRYAELPAWVSPAVAAALHSGGMGRLWSHQAQAAEAVHSGEHVVLSTGTASGKSLGYLVPILSDLLDGSHAPTGRGATALYLAPTKALSHDQLARVDALAVPGLRVATYDGDTPTEARRWVREHAAYVLTNPDLLHRTLLPGHPRWAPFLRALRYVVVDECHVYRGVFGSHVALVLRRLRRVCARYRSAPVFVLASATVGSPAQHAEALIGMPVRAVTEDGSPRAAATVALWEPPTRRPLGPDPAGRAGDGPSPAVAQGRRSAVAEAADLLADLVNAGAQTVAFARSRAGVEALAAAAARRCREEGAGGVGHGAGIAAYRGGYLPEDRRALEQDLRSGRLRGLAATTALELGVDIAGLDAVVVAGWPGSTAAFRQQIGRAGRTGRDCLAVLVAADDPLDSYLVAHPDVVFDPPAETPAIDPHNPHVLAAHLVAAAAELPVREQDAQVFGAGMPRLLADLVERSVLRRRPGGWYWTGPDPPAARVSLRGAMGSVRIVERGTGRVLGDVDSARADATVHPGAVYVHQGRTFLVVDLDVGAGVALVVAADPCWSTQARSVAQFELGSVARGRDWGGGGIYRGTVTVRSRVVSFLRRDPLGSVLGEHPLELPERTMTTQGVWWTYRNPAWSAAGVSEAALPGSLHAAEHAAIGLLPLVVTVDRWDVGGVSTALHPDTLLPTVLVYDGVPAGAGFAEAGYRHARQWLAATGAAVAACGCADGCPGCVQSPKCGNGNHPLDKTGARALLEVLARGLREGPPAGRMPVEQDAPATPHRSQCEIRPGG